MSSEKITLVEDESVIHEDKINAEFLNLFFQMLLKIWKSQNLETLIH